MPPTIGNLLNRVVRMASPQLHGSTGNGLSRHSRVTRQDAQLVAVIMLVAVFAGLVAIGVHEIGSLGLSALWALAALSFGVLVGFLFGIPKVVQQEAPQPNGDGEDEDAKPAAGRPYRMRVNTNLEQISDWLTKILVGLGLVEFKQLPGLVSSAAAPLARGLGDEPNDAAIATAIVVYFAFVGILGGYLLTRMFLAGAMARADRSTIEDDAVAARLEAIETRQELSVDLPGIALELEEEGAAADEKGALPVEEQFQRIAHEYYNVNIPDLAQRTRVKNQLAADLTAFARRHNLSRDELAASRDEAQVLALAGLVLTKPEAEDVERLMKAGAPITRLHVQYRIAMALGQLFEEGLAGPESADRVNELLEKYHQAGDASLRRKIRQVQAQIIRAVSRPA